jgi:hypothetical protein
VVAIGFDQGATGGKPRKLFQQQAALAAPAQAKLPHQLLIAGTASGGAADAGKEIAVRRHDAFDGIPRLSRARNRLWRYHLGARLGEKIIDEGCNFPREVSNMQTKAAIDADAPLPLISCTC